MKFLSQADYKIMPWKNGGGTTTEIAIYPEKTGISGGAFIWRVSIAEAVNDGPFSLFPGYDRHIMMIAGNGMILDAGQRGKITLEKHYKPASFSGDWQIEGTLIAGPVRDFNLISARDLVKKSTLDARVLKNRTALHCENDNTLVYLLVGELSAAGRVMAETESIVLFQDERLDVSPLSNEAILAVADIAYK